MNSLYDDFVRSSSRLVFTALIGLTLTGALAAQTQAPPKTAPKTNTKTKSAPAPDPAPKPAAKPAPKPTDLEIRARYTSDAQLTETTTSYKGPRQRVQFPGMVVITQCDAKQTIQLNDKSKRFMVQPLADPTTGGGASGAGQPGTSVAATPSATPAAPPATPPAPAGHNGLFGQSAGAQKPKGGLITFTTTTTDTGERKTLFGSEARHITVTTVREASADACDKRATKIETDAWYIDPPVPLTDCENVSPAPQAQPADASCVDRTEAKQSGEAKLGFVVASTLTTTEEKTDGKVKENDVRIASMEIVDLQVTSLDAALFSVPAGYTEVKTQAELLSSATDNGAGASESSTGLSDALFGSLADGTRKVAPKKAGVLRIGVVDPTNTGGRDVSPSTLSGTLVRSMNSKPFEAVPIQGATVADLARDAQAKSCDYILTSDLAELKATKPNKVGSLLKKASGDSGSASDIYDARMEFKLFSLADRDNPDKPFLTSNAKANSGGGFTVGSALHLATWAGTMYMTMGMGTMMGPLMGMNALGMGGLGGLGAGRMGMGTLMMGPAMGSAMSIMSRTAMTSAMSGKGGMFGQRPGPDPAMEKTVSEACEKVGKAVTSELKKKKA